MQRSFNRSLVLQKVRQAGRISRVDLSRSLGLEKSSVSAIVAELIEQRLLHETEVGEASVSGGRKPVYLELNGSFCCFLGLELQPTRYQADIVDLGGRVLHRENGAVTTWEHGFEATLNHLFRQLEPTVAGLAARGLPLAALSLGVPGLVNPQSGFINLSVPHSLHEWDFSRVSNPWGVPAFVENDANCCAWATLLDSTASAHSDFLTILLELQDRNPLIAQEAGVSLGLGLVINGEVYYGPRFEAGEFRSLFWREGNRSQTGIPDHELEGIARDPATLDKYLTEVLLNLIPVCSLLAPQRIILCGEAGKAHERICALLEGPLADSWLGRSDWRERIAASAWENEAVAIGAAARLIISLFNSRSLSKTAVSGALSWDQLIARFAPGAT
jgi:predicted NBD/HSP70 family sugar kinase